MSSLAKEKRNIIKAKPYSIAFWKGETRGDETPPWEVFEQTAYRLDGKEQSIETSGVFYKIKREFADGDEIVLTVKPQVTAEKSSDGGVYFTRGSLVFALGLRYKEKKVPAPSNANVCNYNLTADEPWNYCIDESECTEKEVRLFRNSPNGQNPWTLTGVPLHLTVPAHRLVDWQLLHKTEVTLCTNLYAKQYRQKTGDFTFTSPLPEKTDAKVIGEKETISLIPMGAAKIRVTVFPTINKGE